MSTVTITDFDTPRRVEHVVFDGRLLPLDAAATHALALNAQLLALGDCGRERDSATVTAAYESVAS